MMDPEHNHNIAPTTDDQLYHAIGQLAADAGLPPPLFLKNLRADARGTAHPRRALTSFHRFLMTGFPSAWLRDFEEWLWLRHRRIVRCKHCTHTRNDIELFFWHAECSDKQRHRVADQLTRTTGQRPPANCWQHLNAWITENL